MENFEINILIECVAQLRIIKQRIENVNDDKARELCEAVDSIDNAIDLIECEGITVESKDAALQQAPVSVALCKHPYTDWDGMSERCKCKNCGEWIPAQ